MSAHTTSERADASSQDETLRRTCAVLNSIARSYPANSVEASAIREAALACETIRQHEHLQPAYEELQISAQPLAQPLDPVRYRSPATIAQFLAAIVVVAWLVLQIGFALWLAAKVPSNSLMIVSFVMLVLAYSFAALWLARFAARLYREQLKWRPIPRGEPYSGPPKPMPHETPRRG